MADPSLPTPRRGVLDIEAYVPGESHLPSGITPVKLSSNETPLGPSPKAIAAYAAAGTSLERYPDGQATILKSAIAKRFDLDTSRIVCGSGSDELLSLIAQAFLSAGDEAIFTEHGFLVYRIVTLAAGATPVVAKEQNLTCDIDAILSAVTPRTKIVFIANPNNPTGTYLPHAEIERLRSKLPSNILLVLDAAYAEYVQNNDYDAGIKLVEKTENTVMTRTFSKIFGLAGLRIGWSYCPTHIADVLNRTRGPFNLSVPSIAAGAAAMEDWNHVEAAVAHNAKAVPQLTTEIEALGLQVTPSVANFILIHFGDADRQNATACDEFLKSQAILLRRVRAYGLPNALRMTIGTDEENRRVVSALRQFVGATR